MAKEVKATGIKACRRPEGRGLASFKPKPEDDRPREKLLKKGTGGFE